MGHKKDRLERRLSWFCRHLVPSIGLSETRVLEARTSSRWPHVRAAHQQSRYVLQSYQIWTMEARATCSPHNCWFAESSYPAHWMTAVTCAAQFFSSGSAKVQETALTVLARMGHRWLVWQFHCTPAYESL